MAANEVEWTIPTLNVREGLDATGTPEGALKYYFGGPDQSMWGPKTMGYAAKGQQVYQTVAVNPGTGAPTRTTTAKPQTVPSADGDRGREESDRLFQEFLNPPASPPATSSEDSSE